MAVFNTDSQRRGAPHSQNNGPKSSRAQKEIYRRPTSQTVRLSEVMLNMMHRLQLQKCLAWVNGLARRTAHEIASLSVKEQL